METEGRSVAPRGRGVTASNDYEVSFWGHENVLELDRGDVGTTLQVH